MAAQSHCLVRVPREEECQDQLAWYQNVLRVSQAWQVAAKKEGFFGPRPLPPEGPIAGPAGADGLEVQGPPPPSPFCQMLRRHRSHAIIRSSRAPGAIRLCLRCCGRPRDNRDVQWEGAHCTGDFRPNVAPNRVALVVDGALAEQFLAAPEAWRRMAHLWGAPV